MIVEASITGLFRTLLILIGVFVLLRFLGQLMNAKRNMDEERKLAMKDRKFQKEKERKKVQLGKTSIIKKAPQSAEDVDYEEVSDH